MRLVFMRCVLVTLLVNCAASLGYAQDLLRSGDWPTQFRDPANTGNTPVVLDHDNLKVLWEQPAAGGSLSPRLFINRSGQHLVIAGNCIYGAHTGALLHYLPDAGDRSAITTTTIITPDGLEKDVDVLLTGRARDNVRNSGYEFFAYDLSSFERLWYLDSTVSLTFDAAVQLNAKDDTFFISGCGNGTQDGLAAVDAGTGRVRWRKSVWNSSVEGTAAAQFDGADWVFMAQWGYPCGVVAFRESATGDDASEQWRLPYFSVNAPPCVDQVNGLVYFGAEDGSFKLLAYNAVSGQLKWAQTIDAILNGAPTLGWAKGGDGSVHEAVFVVTGGDDGQTGIYARDRLSGAELWTAWVPGEAYTSAVYSGDSSSGKLYVPVNNYSPPDNDGSIYVFDALTGGQPQRLAVNYHHWGQPCPVIAEVQGVDQNGNAVTEGVLYFRNGSGNVAAWSPSGTNPAPPVPVVQSLRPEVNPIAVNSSTKVFATVVDQNSGVPIVGARVYFSCNAANNQGYLLPIGAVYTDANGVATTTFFSQSRTGTITVTARATAGTATTTITVVKSTGEQPPTSGSIQGTVYYLAGGKPARNATVELWLWDESGEESSFVAATTTNAKGKYSFQGVPFGSYTVYASANQASGRTDVAIWQSSPSATADMGLQ